ncbi:MAG: LLM class flavin-dependent oxidoreductase, partial [Patulibacter sp.]
MPHPAGRQRQLHLNAFLMNVGHHEAAWRHPLSDPQRGTSLAHYVELAQLAERGLLDSIFFADGLYAGPSLRYNAPQPLDPFSLLFAIAARTEQIGLISTVSTTYTYPYDVARKFATLDHLSGGRAGWNIVTSGSGPEADNFDPIPRLTHAERYAKSDEYVRLAKALWDSWEDGAIVADQAAGLYADTDRIHPVDHHGDWFGVRGPLNVPRTPQGWPLLVQAGSSEDGKRFAAQHAEAVFTAHQTLESAQEFYADLKARTVAQGRDPDAIKVLPGVVPFIAETEQEAYELRAQLDGLINPEYALRQLAILADYPAAVDLPLDEPFPDLRAHLDSVQNNQSRSRLIVELALRRGLTTRQLLGELGGGRGHFVFAGTPAQLADHLQRWFEQGAADGFNIMAPLLPFTLERFVDQVVPILQARGLFRTAYEGATLRDRYGLPRPASHQQALPRGGGWGPDGGARARTRGGGG